MVMNLELAFSSPFPSLWEARSRAGRLRRQERGRVLTEAVADSGVGRIKGPVTT